jgi:hypothetical protein
LHDSVNGPECRLYPTLTLSQAKHLLGSPRKIPDIIYRAIWEGKIARTKEHAAVKTISRSMFSRTETSFTTRKIKLRRD